MKKIVLPLLPMLCAITLTVHAQSLWTSADVKVKLAKGLSANIEGENRTTDGIDGFERWAASTELNYKPAKWLKFSVGYTFIYQHTDSKTTKKGNVVSDYWQPRHRFSFGMTGSYETNSFTFSLRERYQYTYRSDKYIEKYDGDNGSRKDNEYIGSKKNNDLRSRFQVEYSISNSGFMPFVSFEIYNNLSDGFSTKKTRWTLGTEYKINKKHSLSLYYRYINKTDDDDNDNHVIGIGYSLRL